MGLVRRAIECRTGREVALKELLTDAPGDIKTAVVTISQIYLQGGVEKFSDRPAESFAELGLPGFLLVITLVVEWPEKLHEFTPTTNVYGSLYFTITGFHAMHVLVGLGMSLWAQVRAWKGAFDAEKHVTVQNFTMYWHFVDVVWVFVFATIYLSPHL